MASFSQSNGNYGGGILATAIAILLFFDGPLWRATPGSSHVGRILVSYLTIVPLVAAALAIRRRATWMRLTNNGSTRKKPAIVALARRLLVRCWAMLRDGTPWRGEPAPAMAAAT